MLKDHTHPLPRMLPAQLLAGIRLPVHAGEVSSGPEKVSRRAIWMPGEFQVHKEWLGPT